MNKPIPDSGAHAQESNPHKQKRLHKVVNLLLAALLVLSPLTALLTNPASAYAAAMNTGNPFTNGDLVQGSDRGRVFWTLAGSYRSITVFHEGVADAGSWDSTQESLAGNAPEIVGKGYYSLAGIWSASAGGWGVSDFSMKGNNLWSTTIPATGVNLGVDAGNMVLHCIQHTHDTTGTGVVLSAFIALYKMDYNPSTGVYTGQFYVMAYPYAPDDGQFQAMASKELITITWQDTGNIKLTKSSSNIAISSANSCYSLNGAVYGIYPTNADAKAGTNAIQSLTLTGDGNSSTATSKDLTPGTYYVKETKAPKGYATDTTVYTVVVSGGKTNALDILDKPQNDPVTMWLGKIDAETTKNMPLGAASLADAQFEVKYYDGYYTASNLPASSVRSWIVKTDEDGFSLLKEPYKVSGDAFYYSSTGAATVPLGTVTIREVKAPEGYLLGSQPLFVRQITSGTYITEPVETYNEPSISDQVKRGDLEFIKAGAVTYERTANVPFMITSKATGEAHAIVTDANGYASTTTAWNPHSQNTNKGTSPECGVWFAQDTKGNKAPVDNAKGALPYGVYTVTEQACAANAGRDLLPPIEVTISRDNYTVDLGTLTNQWIALPEIGTTAKDKDSDTQQACAVGKTTLVDTVYYKNLKVGKAYTLSGSLIDQSTGQALSVDGHAVTASKTFTPKTTDGSVDMEFTFDATGLGGHNVVVFESLSLDGTEVAVHADINDGGQTVLLITPAIGTTATAKGSEAKSVFADSPVTITDTVAYSNLVPGKSYTLTGTLYDKTTGKPVVSDGKEVTATKDFTSEDTSGTVALDFTFDARTLGRHEVVVFETVTRGKVTYATHADIDDAGQTVSVISPEVRTRARDKLTATNQITEMREVTIIDTVTYKNLVVGKSYTLTGILMDKSKEATLTVGGSPVTTTKEFTPEASDGTVDVEFTFDATGLSGHDLVVFETLYRGGVEVGAHADITDAAQTVTIVKPPAPKPTPPQKMPKTGDTTEVGFLALVAGFAAGLVIALLALKYRKAKKIETEESTDNQ